MNTATDMMEQEQKALDEQLEGLMKEHRGEFVLMKGGLPVAFFNSSDDAFREALKQFGLDSIFLISRVEREQPQSASLAWDAGVMFGA